MALTNGRHNDRRPPEDDGSAGKGGVGMAERGKVEKREAARTIIVIVFALCLVSFLTDFIHGTLDVMLLFVFVLLPFALWWTQ